MSNAIKVMHSREWIDTHRAGPIPLKGTTLLEYHIKHKRQNTKTVYEINLFFVCRNIAEQPGARFIVEYFFIDNVIRWMDIMPEEVVFVSEKRYPVDSDAKLNGQYNAPTQWKEYKDDGIDCLKQNVPYHVSIDHDTVTAHWSITENANYTPL